MERAYANRISMVQNRAVPLDSLNAHKQDLIEVLGSESVEGKILEVKEGDIDREMLESYIIELDPDFYSCAAEGVVEIIVNHGHFTTAQAEMFFTAVASCTTVKVIRLHWCEFEGKGFHFLCTAIEKSNIKVVELDEVLIEGRAASSLAKAIRINNDLVSLRLKDNGLTEKTIKPIAKALQDDEYLTHLSIEHNKIGRDGFYTVIDCIKTQQILKHLHITTILIKEGEAQKLASLLRDPNSCLKELWLNELSIGHSVLQMIVEAIKDAD